MQMAPDMTVIVNGDDALSAYLAMESGNPYVTYGITEQVFHEQDTGEIREGRFCKRCGERLEYDFYHYSQLGMYHCPKCGFARPEVDFDAEHIDMAHGLNFDIARFGRSASCEPEDGKHGVNRRLPAETAHISVNYKGFTISTTSLRPTVRRVPEAWS